MDRVTAGTPADPRPPRARKDPRETFIHGERLIDEYHWLRRKEDAEVHAHLEAENAYADAVMSPTLAFQERLYAEMLGRIKEDDDTVPYRRGGYFYYSRTEKGKQYPIHCRKRESLTAPEEVTLDLNALAAGLPFMALGMYTVSDDEQLLAYTTDTTGFREYTLHVKDLRTGALLEDRVARVSSVAWAADSATLFLVTEDDAKRAYRLWKHRLGERDDTLLWEEEDELFRLGVWRSRSRTLILAASRSFTTTEHRYLPADRVDAPWRTIAAREKDHEYEVDHGMEGGTGRFYIRTNAGGRRNFRLVVAPDDDTRVERWTELIPHRDDVMLEDVDVFADHYVVLEREEGLNRLRVVTLADGVSRHVQFPEAAYDIEGEANPEFTAGTYRFAYQSFITPHTVYDYHVSTGNLELLKRQEVLGEYDANRYRVERLHASAADGVRVPISLVCRKDTPRDGSSPLLLAGYGAYGIVASPVFSSNRLSLLDRGVAFAIAHVRGGGDMGKRWHDDGRMLKKKNTFTDFVACAEHLIARGYTAPSRLVIEGGSAGGLLMGAVLNMRPELFHAAILRVPFVDVINTMLDESLPLTVGEFEEWGNPKIREAFEYMKSYCPYTNIGPRRYPMIFVRTALNDSQVMYWEPAKWVARMRDRKIGDQLLLFKINMAAGHGGASGRYDFLREIALDHTFTLTALGRAS
ncbi:MAG TPA: S9 family peptidase [Methylomirabilota bacterium]|nr:S9 family peptidase [Methylomirabilota bacterium]